MLGWKSFVTHGMDPLNCVYVGVVWRRVCWRVYEGMCSNVCEGMCELTAQIDGYFNLYA